MISLLISLLISFGYSQPIEVGSKNFVEGYVLSEIVSQKIENETQLKVKRNFGLGGTGIVFRALNNDRIDMYVEYTGTLAEVILKKTELKTVDQLNEALTDYKMKVTGPLGFNNSYALAVTKEFSEKHNLRTISDLAKLNGIARYAFSSEFISREDGLKGLKSAYGFEPGKNLFSMEHALVYGAITNKSVDVIEVYSTDAKIKKMKLVLLEDDKAYFPKYEAVVVVREDFIEKHPEAWEAIRSLEGTISEQTMQELNGMIDLEKKSFSFAAKSFLHTQSSTPESSNENSESIAKRAKEHLTLVFYSLLAAFIIGLPLAIVAREYRGLGQAILITASLIQTIPALALLCFLIPWFGIGQPLALFALFLYGLLPITLNSYNGLIGIETQYLEVSKAMGIKYWRRLIIVDLPLASPLILSGIKTSAIIGIGTATLAALVGAGGFGAPIVTGLALNDNRIILMGAVPAAVFAFATYVLLSLLERVLIPKGLRQ